MEVAMLSGGLMASEGEAWSPARPRSTTALFMVAALSEPLLALLPSWEAEWVGEGEGVGSGCGREAEELEEVVGGCG